MKENLSTVQEIMKTSTDYLRRIIGHICARIATVSRWKTASGGSLGEKVRNNWWCANFEEKYDWKQPNRLLVVQTGESVNQAKVFRAHAVPQGLLCKI